MTKEKNGADNFIFSVSKCVLLKGSLIALQGLSLAWLGVQLCLFLGMAADN